MSATLIEPRIDSSADARCISNLRLRLAYAIIAQFKAEIGSGEYASPVGQLAFLNAFFGPCPDFGTDELLSDKELEPFRALIGILAKFVAEYEAEAMSGRPRQLSVEGCPHPQSPTCLFAQQAMEANGWTLTVSEGRQQGWIWTIGGF